MKSLTAPALGMALAALACSSSPAALVQWDFNGSLAPTVGASALAPASAPPAASPGINFTNVTIAGQSAQVAAFTRGTHLRLSHGFSPNAGGAFVNQYTLLVDVMFPERPSGWAALWQTSVNNDNDGEWFINPDLGLGISGNYGGTVADGVWHRLGLVVNAVAGTFTSYVDGQPVQQNLGVQVDGRFALGPIALLFADEDQENAAGLVNSVQLRDLALSPADLAELGGPTAAGLAIPALASIRVTYPNGGEQIPAGSLQRIAWTSSNPSGSVQVDLLEGGQLRRTLGQALMRDLEFLWQVDPRQSNGAGYQVRLTATAFAGLSDRSDTTFTILGNTNLPNPRFGQALQTNGGFEAHLTNWQTLLGRPTTLTAAAGLGAARTGARFFHAGPSPGGDGIVRQDIDLLAAGFSVAELDAGCALEAEAWLRNLFPGGVFDDQVYWRVGYVNAAGEETASVRCMIPANGAWTPRSLAGRLPAGTRRLRVEVVGRHRQGPANESMADDISVRVEESLRAVNPNLTKLPMLQGVQADAMTLLWETDGNLAWPAVEWGRSNVTEQILTRIETLMIDETHFVHRATIPGLQRATRYVYRVRNGATVSPTFSFQTAPQRDTPFAVAWWGDSHSGTTTLRTHVSNLLAHAPNFIAVAGDMVNNGNVLSEWHNYWFKPLEHLHAAQTTPVIYARGNHDGEHALAYAYSTLPGNEAWFAFDYGNTRFIFLDSEVGTGTSPEQLAWLRAELARPETQQAAFRVVCFHRPPFVNLWNGGGYSGEPFVRNDWVPLFSEHNVDLVISGHAHNYNRGISNSVVYVVSGGGGGTLDVERVTNWPLFVVEYSRYHFDLMEVNGDQLTWQAFDDKNQLLDQFVLRSRTPTIAWRSVTGTNGALRMVLSGRPGLTYVIEGSTNFQSWQPVSTNPVPVRSTGIISNSLPNSGPFRFFRARTR